MSERITWDSFGPPENPTEITWGEYNRDTDHDIIKFVETATAHSNDQLEVVLSTGGNNMDWKGIEVFDNKGDIIGAVYTQGRNRGPVSATVSLTDVDLDQSSLHFLKAKMWGIHTGMYYISGLGPKAGAKLEFTWAQDHKP